MSSLTDDEIDEAMVVIACLSAEAAMWRCDSPDSETARKMESVADMLEKLVSRASRSKRRRSWWPVLTSLWSDK